MTERSDVLKNPVVALAVGTAAVAVEGATVASRLVFRLPVIGPLARRGVHELTALGERVINDGLEPAREMVTAVVLQIIDIDAIIDRIDLVGLADKVIDGVDLPAIIRDSTNSVTAEVMTDVRSQGERADDIVAGMVDRLLRRSRDDAE